MNRENQKYSFIILEQNIRKATFIRREIRKYYEAETKYLRAFALDKELYSNISDSIDDACTKELFTVLILGSDVSHKGEVLELFQDIADGMVAYSPGVILYTAEDDFEKEREEIYKALDEHNIHNWELYEFSDAFAKLDEIQEEILTGEDREIDGIYSDEIGIN